MQQARQYSRTPLREAVIEIKIKPKEGLTIAALTSLGENFGEDYPLRQERSHLEGMINLASNSTVQATRVLNQIGYEYRSIDQKQVLQTEFEKFSFDRLSPYNGWDAFSREARRLWKFYRDTVAPKAITRIGLRYINQLELPLPFDDFRKYLKTVPEVSSEIPEPGLAGYFMQLQMPQEDLKSILVLSQAMLPIDPQPKSIKIVLDIDIFREIDLFSDEDKLWQFLDELRHRKNDVFNACITDDLKELIS